MTWSFHLTLLSSPKLDLFERNFTSWFQVERQRWVTALELAKAKAIQRMESEDDESSGGILGGSGLSHDLDDDRGQEIDKIELINIVKLLGSKLEDLQTCHDLIVKHGLALQRSLGK